MKGVRLTFIPLRGYGFDGEVVGLFGFDSSQSWKGLVEFPLEMQSIVLCVCVFVFVCGVHMCVACDAKCRNKPFPWRLLQCVAW